MKKLLIKITAGVAFLAMVIVNFLANFLPINGIGTGEVSDLYPNLFAPAGITFSIWGIIYLLLGLYVLYQLDLFQKRKIKNNLIGIVAKFFIISSVSNILWIFSWHYGKIWLSLLFMVVILYCLIRISKALKSEKLTGKEYFFMRLPFSIYFGWITVATIANVTALLVSIGWKGFGLAEATWAVIVIALGAGIGLLRTIKDKDIAYGLVFIWAFTGILIKHTTYFESAYKEVIMAAILSIAVMTIGITITLVRTTGKSKR